MDNSVTQAGPAQIEPKRRRGTKTQLLLLISAILALILAAIIVRETNPTRSQVRSLRSTDEATRREAASALSNTSTLDLGVAVPALAEALASDASIEVRSEAGRTLGTLGAEAIRRQDGPARDQALNALVSAIKDKEPNVRQVALTMIPALVLAATNISKNEYDVRLVGDPEVVVSKVFPALNDPAEAVRVAAATTLGFFPIQLDPSLPMLLKASAEEKPSAGPRGRAVMGAVLRKVRPMPSSLPFLMESIGSDDLKVRSLAVSALGQMSTDAESAVPALIRILKDPAGADEPDDPGRAAATALGAIAPETSKADEARTALKEAQADAPEGRKRAISAALRNFEAAP